jgi:mono/diheme cytochrome c family protein
MTRPWKLGLIAAGLAGVVVVLVMIAGLFDRGPGRADPRDARAVALGRDIYSRHCMSCHGRDLKGEPDWRMPKANGRLPAPPHDETGHTWHHSDRQLFILTKVGPRAFAGTNYQTDMPGFADILSDAETWAVLAYIKSRWPARILEYQEEVSARER